MTFCLFLLTTKPFKIGSVLEKGLQLPQRDFFPLREIQMTGDEFLTMTSFLGNVPVCIKKTNSSIF